MPQRLASQLRCRQYLKLQACADGQRAKLDKGNLVGGFQAEKRLVHDDHNELAHATPNTVVNILKR